MHEKITPAPGEEHPMITPENAVDQKIEQEIKTAEKHANKNRVKADPQREICVDGGTRKRENQGALARPGGDAGLALVI